MTAGRYSKLRTATAALTVPALLAAALILPVLALGTAMNFGSTHIHKGCLHISAQSYTGHQGEFDNHDWVSVKVTNKCTFPVKHLKVALALVDGTGQSYGRNLWLLGKGTFLPPGKSVRERFAIPDPDNRIAVGWKVRVLKVSRVGGRGFKPDAPARKE
ncbi:MAG: hypothetical protein O7A08_04395 [SAR324 cluster bacterium]|nr:hypothetical protein [SAR324 cluster bacterium]MCZ6532186.1 hypothetical protein [SAR324 cluster bacterium]MCZ6556712.1 hypothetical protein [SAR324 cluster bacterium]MCZ6842342.1 hypothetical protein [SAR324 cluster bacterium]